MIVGGTRDAGLMQAAHALADPMFVASIEQARPDFGKSVDAAKKAAVVRDALRGHGLRPYELGRDARARGRAQLPRDLGRRVSSVAVELARKRQRHLGEHAAHAAAADALDRRDVRRHELAVALEGAPRRRGQRAQRRSRQRDDRPRAARELQQIARESSRAPALEIDELAARRLRAARRPRGVPSGSAIARVQSAAKRVPSDMTTLV